MYCFLRETFNSKLRRHGLLYDSHVPQDTLVTQIIRDVASPMTREYGYMFAEAAGMYQPHETLPLKLLKIHDRALTRGAAVAPMRLKCSPVDPAWTVYNSLAMRNKFALPDVALERDRFVIFTGTLVSRDGRSRSFRTLAVPLSKHHS